MDIRKKINIITGFPVSYIFKAEISEHTNLSEYIFKAFGIWFTVCKDEKEDFYILYFETKSLVLNNWNTRLLKDCIALHIRRNSLCKLLCNGYDSSLVDSLIAVDTKVKLLDSKLTCEVNYLD